jgi:hypothetical protein
VQQDAKTVLLKYVGRYHFCLVLPKFFDDIQKRSCYSALFLMFMEFSVVLRVSLACGYAMPNFPALIFVLLRSTKFSLQGQATGIIYRHIFTSHQRTGSIEA